MSGATATRSSVLLAAIGAATPVPEALVAFDGIAGARDPEPDFLEWSVRVADVDRAAGRLTYYFDVARRGADVARSASARFASLAGALGVRPSSGFASALENVVAGRPEVLQLVLGVEDGGERGRRVKVYAVLQDAAPGFVDDLVTAAGAVRPPALDAERVYILGFDHGAGGLVDVKLYYRLDSARLGRVVSNLGQVRELLDGTRDVVLQRGILSDRSQLYLHATNAEVAARHIESRARDDASHARLLERYRAANDRLARGRLEPWIVAFGLDGHALKLAESTVYFHHVGTDDG